MRPRYLITTADERTWPTKQPVLFLGEWCRLHKRKAVWEKLDAEVVHYHWDDREKLYVDYRYLEGLHEELLGELANKLNELHGVDHTLRYWRIVIGPWLGYFVQMLFDRWAMIQRALSEHEIAGVQVLKTSAERMVPNDMNHFDRLYLEDLWNEAIYGQLLRDFTNVVIEDVPGDGAARFNSSSSSPIAAKSLPFPRRARHGLACVASRLSRCLVRENEAFFIASYLPISQDLRLQWELGQIPKIWRPFPAPRAAVEKTQRRWILGGTTGQGFERIVRMMIPKQIPTLYLEGYQALRERIRGLPWPKKPRLIFTSNSYSSDDVFKAWAAQHVETGTPLVIGQHGGHYGAGRWSFVEEHEIAISDSYISWGWETDGAPKVVPVLATKLTGRGKGKWRPRGDALLVTCSIPRYGYFSFSAPEASQWLCYFNDQCRFVDALPYEIRRRLLVRLYVHDYGWDQAARWRERFPDLRLNDGTDAMEPLVCGSRLYISTYNATTFLESLARNVPTIMFWNPKHWELRPSAQSYFDRLQQVGIFHDTPESAAAKVTEIWENVPGWWNQDELQEARGYFSDRFARMPGNPDRVLGEVLASVKPGALA